MSEFEFGPDRLRAVAREAFMETARRRATTLDWENSMDKKVAERQFRNWWEMNYE